MYVYCYCYITLQFTRELFIAVEFVSFQGYVADKYRFGIFIPYYAIIFIQLVLSCFAEKITVKTEDRTKVSE